MRHTLNLSLGRLSIVGILAVVAICTNCTAIEAADVPVITKTFDPIHADETAMFYGGSFSADAIVNVARLSDDAATAPQDAIVPSVKEWKQVQPVQITTCSIKCLLPNDLEMGVFVCRISAGGAESKAVLLNAPDPWWLQGDAGESASPGGWVRIFGKCLSFGKATKALLRSADGKSIVLEPKKADCYALSFDLPASLALGDYTVFVHNGFGGDAAWASAGTLSVKPAVVWKKEVFNVKEFGSDATKAIKAALKKAAANGGGVVYFPRGRYEVQETLDVPPGVILRGEGRELVNLFWPGQEVMRPALIRGTDSFTVEDLTLYTQGPHGQVISGRNNVTVQRCRIRASAFYRHDWVGKSHSVKPLVFKDQCEWGRDAIFLTGNNGRILDNDIYHTVSALSLLNSRNVLVARNRFACGSGPGELYGSMRVIYEDNDYVGAGLFASGMGIAIRDAASFHVYFAHNTLRQMYGRDREAMTLDEHGCSYLGGISSAVATKLTLAANPTWVNGGDTWALRDWRIGTPDAVAGQWHGITLYIIDGKGAGQYRNLSQCKGRDIEVDRPWDILPDSTSVVTIGCFNGRHLFIGNHFADAGTSVQLFMPNTDCIVAENEIERVDSTNASGLLERPEPPNLVRVDPSWFNQFLDNVVVEGNSWGMGQQALSIFAQGNQTNVLGGAGGSRPIWISRGHVIRGNTMKSNGRIEVCGAVADVVVENNTVNKSDVGIRIAVGAGNCPANILLHNNHFQDVKEQFQGEGVGKALILPTPKPAGD